MTWRQARRSRWRRSTCTGAASIKRERLSDATNHSARYRAESPVAQEEHAIDQRVHARYIARSDDERAMTEPPNRGRVERIQQQERGSADTAVLLTCLRAHHAPHWQQRADLAGIGAAGPRDALQQCGLAGPWAADDRYTLTERDVQRAGTQRPDADRAATYASRVALPEIVDHECVWHGAQCGALASGASPKCRTL